MTRSPRLRRYDQAIAAWIARARGRSAIRIDRNDIDKKIKPPRAEASRDDERGTAEGPEQQSVLCDSRSWPHRSSALRAAGRS